MRRLLLALTLLTACAPKSPKALYERDADDATRELTIYSEFTTALLLRGTLLTPEFRDTMSDYREALLEPLPDNQARFESRMTDDAQAYHEVVFSADSAMPGKLRFGPGDDRWNVRLTADGTVEPLVTVYPVRRPTPLHYGMYPHLNQWSELYIARFHRTVEAPEEVVFHVGSGHGHGELVWSDAP